MIIRFSLARQWLFIALLGVNSSVFAGNTLAQLEANPPNGRLGIAAINMADNSTFYYHAYDRFAFCSTAKFMVVAAILKASMTHPHLLQETLTYRQADLTAYSPFTTKNLGQHPTASMTIADLCAAAMLSDSTAMNLLTQKLGGPQAINAFARSIGDDTFRLDRWEPEINSAIPNDVRDTTTPAAMARDVQKLVMGNVLGATQRELLQTWLKNNTTGNLRIRAGVPTGWIVGDKTGTGDYGTTNDIGVIWVPHCPPLVIAIYYTQPNAADAEPRNDIIASATRMVISQFADTDLCLKNEE